MTTRHRALVAGMLFAVAAHTAAPAAARDLGPYSVRSGVPSIVMSYAAYDPESCLFQALPRLRVMQPPAHGAVSVAKSAHVIDAGPCAGKTMKSAAATYRAKPGFRGRDEVVIAVESEVFTDGTGVWGDTVRILLDVK